MFCREQTHTHTHTHTHTQTQTHGHRHTHTHTHQVFANEGSNVVFCARNEGEGKALESEINALGKGKALFVKCDVSKEEELKRVVDATVEAFGRIDCLINNACVLP